MVGIIVCQNGEKIFEYFERIKPRKSHQIREELKDDREEWARTSKQNVNVDGDVKALLANAAVG